jgi:hypothetical protein
MTPKEATMADETPFRTPEPGKSEPPPEGAEHETAPEEAEANRKLAEELAERRKPEPGKAARTTAISDTPTPNSHRGSGSLVDRDE